LTFLVALLILFRFWRGFLSPLSPKHPAHHSLCEAAASGEAKELERLLNRGTAEIRESYYVARFERLINRLNKDPADTAPERERLTILEEDEEEAAATLITVDWCETALPVLGFLGTVIGLAKSLSDIQSLNVTNEAPVAELLATLLSAFEGVGFAFDTTFLGLASMLVVAGFHASLRKATSRRLAEAGAIFESALRAWVTASPARDLQRANAGLASVQAMILKASADLESVQAMIVKAGEDRESARAMVEQVLLLHPSPALGQAREILLYPVVMFHELSPPPDQSFQRYLSNKAPEGWEYTAFGLSGASLEDGLITAKAQDGTCWIARLELNGFRGGEKGKEDRQEEGERQGELDSVSNRHPLPCRRFEASIRPEDRIASRFELLMAGSFTESSVRKGCSKCLYQRRRRSQPATGSVPSFLQNRTFWSCGAKLPRGTSSTA
jgi:hypothetical protein